MITQRITTKRSAAIGPAMTTANLVYISPSATRTDLTKGGTFPTFGRVVPNDDAQGPTIASFVKDRAEDSSFYSAFKDMPSNISAAILVRVPGDRPVCLLRGHGLVALGGEGARDVPANQRGLALLELRQNIARPHPVTRQQDQAVKPEVGNLRRYPDLITILGGHDRLGCFLADLLDGAMRRTAQRLRRLRQLQVAPEVHDQEAIPVVTAGIIGGTLGEGAAISSAMIPFLLGAILISWFGLQRRKWQQGESND